MISYKEFKKVITENRKEYLSLLKKELSTTDYNEFLMDINEPDSIDKNAKYFKNAIGMIKNWMKEDDYTLGTISDESALKYIK